MSTITQFPSGNTQYRIEFDYLARTFVVVTLVNSYNPTMNRVLEVGRDYRFLNPTMIEMLVDQSGFDIVRIHRQTGTDLVVDFRNGSVLTASDLTNAELQAIHIAEEGRDQTVDLAKEYADAAGSSAGNAKDSEDEARRIAASIQAAGKIGYITRRSFEKGFNVTTWNEALLWEEDGDYYRWDGTLPKNVPAGSTPESSGGIGLGAWVSVGDASLRSALQAEDGAKNIGSGKRKLIDNLNDIKHSGDYSTLQQAINDTTSRGRVLVSPGVYSESVSTGNADIEGSGYASLLKTGSEDYAIKVLQSVPHWERRSISKISLQGTATPNSVGVLYDPDDMLSGRWDISYVGMADFGVCIKKPTGNIGNTYQTVNFRASEYGYRAESVTGMHSGCDTFRDCYFQGISKYCIDIVNAQDGGGSVQIQDSIMEQCTGGGIRIDYNNIVPYTPIVIRNVWFELIATASTIDRDGSEEVPRQVKLINTPQAYVEESYLTNIELINSNLIARNCRIDTVSSNIYSMNVDANSSFIVENLYAGGEVGGVPIIKSVASQSGLFASSNLSLRGTPTVQAIKGAMGYHGTVRAADLYSGVVGSTTWTFPGTEEVTANCVEDGVAIGYGCAEVSINAGSSQLSSEIATITAGKWYVWGVNAKLVSGTGNFRFSEYISAGVIYTQDGKWTSTFGIGKAQSSGTIRLYLTAQTDTVIRLQNFFIVEFNTEADALAFCNARVAIG
ncbi:tail fibers protein [Escherichia phage vB_EcoP_IMEP24]|uniref:Probable tail spike protein n=1 Tax=Escherichia phage vB_EcoP_IMEP24 TaxID=2866662 RepID=A0AAE8Y2Z4_9CAUD|nr:tail fibers protein [Escherichia phage vB_EcoP_IMEP24]